MTLQPIWKLVYATDDEALYTDETGVHEAQLAVAQTDEDTGITRVYRFDVDRVWCNPRTGMLTEQDPARASELPYPLDRYEPWYADSLPFVARSIGEPVEDLIAGLTCEDPGTRAQVYRALGDYRGFEDFDQYPEEWTESEFAAWPDRGPRTEKSGDSEES